MASFDKDLQRLVQGDTIVVADAGELDGKERMRSLVVSRLLLLLLLLRLLRCRDAL